MQKPIVKASDLIQTLKNAKMSGDTKVFFDELVKMKDDFELMKSKNAYMMSVEIDTDEDFLLNGKNVVVENVELLSSGPNGIFEDFKNFFEGLSVSVHDSKKSKYEDLKKIACSDTVKWSISNEDFGQTEFVSGNCVVKIKLLHCMDKLDFGYVVVDFN